MKTIFICLAVVLSFSIYDAEGQDNCNIDLNKGWIIFSSQKADADGSTISKPGIILSNIYRTDIPKTILAALVENRLYKNPYTGLNLSNISQEPFQFPWWYRKEFNIKETNNRNNYQLTLEGINYKADLWLNGKKLAGKDIIEGPFGIYTFNVTNYIIKGKNVIAIEIFPPKPGDLTIGFVDWNPPPPDHSMGIWRGVKLKKTGEVSLDDVFIKTKINEITLDKAELTISGTLKNYSNQNVKIVVKGSFKTNKIFSKIFTIEPNSEFEFSISPLDDSNLRLSNPHLWWPNNMGNQYLYTLTIQADAENKISDKQNIKFGIREVADFINEKGDRGYKINGKKIVIKGAGWVDDLLLNDSDEKVRAEVKYAKQMNLNTLRLEGFWGKDETLYNAADENGILIMTGWSCQWDWKEYCGREETQYSCVSLPKDIELQSLAFNRQVIWLRNHPSILAWVLGSDKYPNPELMKKITEYLNRTDTTRPRLLSAAGIKFTKDENVEGIYDAPRVKMLGPYLYEPPRYWYVDTTHGGAYGFNTETGPGPQVPPIESLKKMLPEKDLWPIDSVWNYHCGKNEFGNLDRYIHVFNKRYGKASSVEEFAIKSQMSNYEAMRPMFESFGVNKFNSTGVIQWKFNSAFPEIYWQLFDSYLMPNGAFYGAMKGCQPLNLVYNYKDKNIYAVNDYYKNYSGLKSTIKIFDANSKVIYEKEKEFSIEENSSKKIIDLPRLNNISKLFFINLDLKDDSDKKISDNFYWVSSNEDSLDFINSKWFYTPMVSYADLKEINDLPKTTVNYSEKYSTRKGDENIYVTLSNNSDKIAFFIELKVVDQKTGKSFLPIYWTDNYISLLPHSTRNITGTFKMPGEKHLPRLIISGWNVNKINKK
ncbi:MAG: glycoside hydrolase family 2 TIM barrel-domain containing protein [Ignavibacteriaceae bacterium]|nr:glycoside hydrolase family 2 TIM barrel-domain containing protein [Ignavibacteriaceae bacterium]